MRHYRLFTEVHESISALLFLIKHKKSENVLLTAAMRHYRLFRYETVYIQYSLGQRTYNCRNIVILFSS